MMKLFWGKCEQENAMLKSKNEKLEREISFLEDVLEQRTKELSTIQKDLEVAARNATPSIDFDGMRALSIERLRKSEESYTIIGYYKSDWSVGEWTVYCNDKLHEKLVAEFNEYKVRGIKNRPVV